MRCFSFFVLLLDIELHKGTFLIIEKSENPHDIKTKLCATIISTDTAHALIDTIITLDKNIIDYIMKY
jgi:hypothetical protein